MYLVVFSFPLTTSPLQCARRQLLGAVSPQTSPSTQGAYSHSQVLVLRLLFVSTATDVQSAQFTREEKKNKNTSQCIRSIQYKVTDLVTGSRYGCHI